MAEGDSPAETGAATAEMDSVQAGARWLMGAAAAVLAILVAGLQLSELADVASRGLVELAWVIGLCLVGLAAISAILVLAARVLINPGWTLNSIVYLETNSSKDWTDWLSKEFDSRRGLILPDAVDHSGAGESDVSLNPLNDEGELQPALSPSRLYRHQCKLLRAWFELLEQGETSVSGDLLHTASAETTAYLLKVPADVETLQQRLRNTATSAARLADLANLLDTRRRYYRLVTWQLPVLGAVAALSVLGLTGFVALKSEIPVNSAVQVDVHFVDKDEILTANNLPATCKNRTVRGVAINGTLSTPVVVSNDPQCPIPQIEVPLDLGTVVPVLPPSSGAPTTALTP